MTGQPLQNMFHDLASPCAGVPPLALHDPYFETVAFAASDAGFLLRLPSGARLFLRSTGGVQVDLPAGVTYDQMQPFVRTTLFAAAAWARGLVPLTMPALRIGAETFLFACHNAAVADALAALVATGLGAAAHDGMIALDPEQPGQCHLIGAPLSMQSDAAMAWLPDLIGQPCTGGQRVALRLPTATATVHLGPVTLIHLGWGPGTNLVFSPLNTLQSANLCSSFAALPELGAHFLGKDLDQAFTKLAEAMSVLNAAANIRYESPIAVAELLCAGLSAGNAA